MDELTLARYEAQGNDFLIALLTERALADLDASFGAHELRRGDIARVVCDRRIGIGTRPGYVHSNGADGFILGVHGRAGSAGSSDVRMHLLNADGSFAETSGNGLACLAMASFDAGIVPADVVPFETDAGVQKCTIGPSDIRSMNRPDVEGRHIAVTMKPVAVGVPAMPDGLEDRIRQDLGTELQHLGTGDVGNPHLVIALGSPIDAVRTAELGAAYQKHFSQGINVEFIWLQDDCRRAVLSMGVWERGAGLTHSCGTGSVVASTLARRWAMVPDHDSVPMVTVPRDWALGGGNSGNSDSKRFRYSVRTEPPPQLRVVAEKIETGLSIGLGQVRDRFAYLAATTAPGR